ncbi:S-layer homology domain-containing protein [Oscillospiraceae bacterium 38-13]
MCEHGKDPDTCEICHPELKKCPHGKDPKTCPTCNPPATDKAPDRPTNSDFTVSPGSVNIGTVEKGATGSSLSSTFRITNNSKYAMNIKADTCSKFSIDLTSKTLSAGESITVTVSLKSAGSTGSFNDRFTITASFTEGAGDSYSTDVYVSATVTEKGNTITVSPTSKDLGKLAEGYTEKEAKEKEITVEITNKGASSVRMYGVKGNDHFTVTAVDDENIRLDYDDDCEYKIVPKKDLKVGTYTDTIVFQTREGATASFKATIVVEKAVDPLTLNVSSLDFGNAEMGYAGLNTQTVTVKNNTDSPLNLEQPSSYNYEIGSVSRTLSAGGTATFTVRPRTGLAANVYNDSLTIRAGNYSTRLDLRFTVTPKLLLAVFADVAEGSTFAADISYVSQKGLMGGVGNGQFKPQNPITRGQLVTILYRLEGQPAVSGSGFTDVKAGSYCEKAVKWAAACGITNGNKDGTFLPDNPISREQMATFLYRYNNYKGYSTTRRADLSTFPDAASVAPYAKDALSWANGSGLVNGTGEGKLNPSGGATRGQAAAILHRFCVSIGK